MTRVQKLTILAAIAYLPLAAANAHKANFLPTGSIVIDQVNDLSSRDDEAIRKAAAYLHVNDSLLGRINERLGFNPPGPPGQWRKYPTYRKILIAYQAAESKEPEKGGQKYLALLAKDLAQRYDSVRHDPTLAALLANPVDPDNPGSIFPTSPRPPTNPPSLSPDDRAAIRSLSDYLSIGRLGSPHVVLQKYFAMSDQDAWDVIETATTNEGIYIAALATLDDNGRTQTLSSLTSALGKYYDSVASDPALRPFLTKPRPNSPSEAGAAPPSVNSPKPPEPPAIARLRSGLDHGWVVTQNPETGKIFVHEHYSKGVLTGLVYLIKVGTNGNGEPSWTVYRAFRGADGTAHYGARVGVMSNPPSTEISSCTCE